VFPTAILEGIGFDPRAKNPVQLEADFSVDINLRKLLWWFRVASFSKF
jgi:hypothetical protein